MPSVLASRRGAMISTVPRAIENQPRPRASAWAAESGRPFPWVSRRIGSAPRLEYDLDAAVLLVAERLVHLGAPLQWDLVGDDEGGVDLTLLDPPQEVAGPSVHVRLGRA